MYFVIQGYHKIVYRPQLAAPPLWMLSLGTYLKEAVGRGVKIKTFDGQILSLKQILDKLNVVRPDFVGMCPKYSSYSNALIIARRAKRLGAKVIFGSHHAGFLAQEILSNRGPASADYCVDACISGDGEKAFYEYVTGKNFSDIKNLVFVKNRKIVENYKEYLDFAILPLVDYELINAKKYSAFNNRRHRMFPAYSHKGCFSGYFDNRACIFCGGDKKLRTRPPVGFLERSG